MSREQTKNQKKRERKSSYFVLIFILVRRKGHVEMGSGSVLERMRILFKKKRKKARASTFCCC
jgi:hypothetical protein